MLRKTKIRAPRRSILPEKDYDTSWNVLSNAILKIQNKNFSTISYSDLYREVYTLVLRKQAGRLYDDVGELIGSQLREERRKLLELHDSEEFMKCVVDQWNEHLQAMQFISDIMMYLDRVYAKENKKLMVYDLGIQLYKDNIVRYNANELGSRIIDTIVSEITRSRRGETITSGLYVAKLGTIMEMLVEGASGELMHDETYYKSVFEPTFLSRSEAFFNGLAEENSVLNGSEYLEKTMEFVRGEEVRIALYLPSSLSKLVELMNNILIKDKIGDVMSSASGMRAWLANAQEAAKTEQHDHVYSDLGVLYQLVGRVDEDFQLLRLRLKEAILQQGKNLSEWAQEKAKEGRKEKKDKKSSPSAFAVLFVDVVFSYQQELVRIVSQCFESNAIIEHGINNALCEVTNASGVSAAEILSLYMDHHIKQGNEEKLTKNALQFLSFVKDKDAFEANYANHFAKRFLNAKVENTDLEELLIARLGEQMGASSLDKVIKMNMDIKSSRDITSEWKKVENDTVDLNMKICNVADWPKAMTKDYQSFVDETCGLIWPRQLRPTIKAFEEFWFSVKRNHSKSLYWSPKFGSMDFRITYPSRTYEINMPTYAGIIMLLFAPQSTNADGSDVSAFDEKKELTFSEIKELTRIQDADLRRHLQSIAVAPRTRLLVKSPMTKEVNNDDVFTLNSSFKAPSAKIKVLAVSAVQKSRKDEDDLVAAITEGRKLEINAAIVRIMKSRRTLKHNMLIEELIKQLQNRFSPQISMIKQRIEDLIEKEYLKRDDEDRGMYHYIA